MQFIVTAHDFTDERAHQRRVVAREAHLSLMEQMIKAGNVRFAVALLNDRERMVGSVLICEFGSRSEIDAWFQREPYITQKVWDKIDIQQCKIGPAFVKG